MSRHRSILTAGLAALVGLTWPLGLADAQPTRATGRVTKARGAAAALRSRAAREDRPSAARLLRDIEVLAADRMEGRFTGSAGNDSAAAFVARRFAALRLRPIVADAESGAPCERTRLTGAPEVPAAGVGAHVHGPSASDAPEPAYPRCGGYLQRFTARSAALAHTGRNAELATQNVVAFLEGSDPALRGQVVVLGAHFDHLGRDATFATDPKAGDAIRNGADDNASGTAAVLELARLLAQHPPRRSVLFVAFSGEELGLLGSQYFVEHAPVPVDSMVAMLNFDMVGRLTDDKLLVYGVATASELPALVDSANAAGPALKVKALGDGFGPSDHSSFYGKDVPVLHFFTDQHADYHAATDDAERINAPGTARVVDLAHRVTRALADRPARPTFQRAATTQRMGGSSPSGGPRPWFGSVPDMSADDVRGMRLSGITPDSPADQAGVKAGDVVVEFGGDVVTDLYSYTDALNKHKPGDVVRVVVLRAPAGRGNPGARDALGHARPTRRVSASDGGSTGGAPASSGGLLDALLLPTGLDAGRADPGGRARGPTRAPGRRGARRRRGAAVGDRCRRCSWRCLPSPGSRERGARGGVRVVVRAAAGGARRPPALGDAPPARGREPRGGGCRRRRRRS
jgi:hypothetical protein